MGTCPFCYICSTWAPTSCGCSGSLLPVVHRHWAPIFSIVHTVSTDTERRAPAATVIVRAAWPAKAANGWKNRQKVFLPIPYFHCVFTLPAQLNPLMLANPRRLYPLLFECAARSLLEFGHTRLHGDLGITAVLHTWGQKLDFLPIFTALSPPEH